MRSIWTAILVLGSSWFFIVPLHESAQPALWAACVVFATLLLAWALRKAEFELSRATALVLVPALVVVALVLPAPYGFGAALAAFGVASARLPGRLARPAPGLVVAGLVLCAQSITLGIHHLLGPRVHGVGVLGRIASSVLDLFGAPALVGPEGLLVSTGLRTDTFVDGHEMFAVLEFALLIAGAFVLAVLASRRRRMLLTTACACLGYAVVRFVVLVLMFGVTARIDLFWRAPFILLTFLPLAVLLARVSPVDTAITVRLPDLVLRDARQWATVGSSGLAALALVGMIGFADPGSHKDGRVLMDEYHSDWEWTTQALDTEWFGEKSGYNYYSLYEFLDLYYEMDHNDAPITFASLEGVSVLIIKTPTEPFTAEEVSVIETFVAEGGGLFLIGDHTNVFGTSTNVAPLAEEFGLRFNHDSTYELVQGSLSEYEPPSLMPHPIVQRLPLFLFATSSSMDVAANAESIITGYGLKAIQADYSQENFFPAVPNASDMRFSPLIQGAAVRHGRGRVAAFADSTVFSNFWMFMPGKPELALAYVDWLDRENSVVDTRAALGVLVAVMFGGAVVAGRGLDRKRALLAGLLGVIIGVPLGMRAWGAVNLVAYAAPEPRRDFVEVCFERRYSEFAVPDTLAGFEADSAESLHTFYVWNQRLGYVPSIQEDLGEAVARADILVVVDPVTVPDPGDVDAIERFVNDGGSLLVLGSAEGGESQNAFLEPFGLRIGSYSTDGVRELNTPGSVRIASTPSGGIVVGGEAWLETMSGESVCSVVRSGSGIAAAFSDSELLHDASLGNVSREPDDRQRVLGELEFDLLRLLAHEGG